jgi:dihydrofolate reductase
MEAILAYDLNNGISKNGIIPWKSKTDINFFYNITKGNIIIMGKNTFFSLPEKFRPLPNRVNIVLTNNPTIYSYDEKYINKQELIFTNNENIHEEILKNQNKYNEMYSFLNPNFKIIIIGGKQIYEKYFPLCKSVWVTRIKNCYQCDLFINYDFEKQFKAHQIYKEDKELIITKYFNYYI